MARARFLALALLTLAVASPALCADEPAAAPGLSDVDRATLIDMLERSRAETEELVARAEGDRFAQKPAADRWSVAEVLEHLGAAETLLFGLVQTALAAEADPEAATVSEAMPVAALAERVQDRSQKAQAPEPLQPKGGQGREDLLAAYRTAREATLAFARSTQAPVASHTATTPLGKLTAHHLLTVIAAHNLRHNQQIVEVLEQTAAPAATTPAAAAQ